MCMINKYIHGRTSVFCLKYQISWTTMYSQKLLSPTIENRLCEILNQVSKEKGFTLVSINVEDMNKVTCVVSASPQYSITQMVKYLKGISGRILLKEYPDLKDNLKNKELWNKCYFSSTIDTIDKDEECKYFQRQEKCQM